MSYRRTVCQRSRDLAPFLRGPVVLRLARYAVAIGLSTAGCHLQPPLGPPRTASMLGASLDELNRTQEENAEQAKWVVYTHEFEMNRQDHPTPTDASGAPPPRMHGLRLTPGGQDHVRQIARQLSDLAEGARPWVIVERSQTSKRWDTQHHYPVHFNDELDALRRQVIVAALESHGVPDAGELVVVAPAFPRGLNADEAAAAFDRTMGGRARSRWR